MYKIKLYLKVSTKKLKKLIYFKNKTITFFIQSLLRENNIHFNLITKKLNVFLEILKNKIKNKEIVKQIYIANVIVLPSVKLKRVNYRAKGKVDQVEKRTSFLILELIKHKPENNNFNFIKKPYILK